ncbi:Gfo/Idh/MocA family protein [Devosia sp.]|jgi:UDP-N-acetyl-2-amino-2-deoxyglucuronate dehydrogenase|uniref:Gfo/Idh/MocA family protein n=1 Tax=Devosia sp. TaxID=1871048 RepID=UPI0037C07AFD
MNATIKAAGALRVGMLGVGGVAAKYRDVYARYPRSRLVSIFDVDASVAQSVAGELGCAALGSAEAMIASDVDAIVINTPNFLHAAQAAAALRAGKHVLLQKPMTVNATEAAELVRVADESGKVLAMYMNSLDNVVMRDLRKMIEAGFFGRVGGINAKLANGRGQSFKTGTGATWRGSRQAVGGGSFAMLATHYINLCQWLLGQPIVSATAVGANLMSGHIEGDDIMASIVTFADGSIGVIESSWCVKGEQMSVHGSEGSAAYIDNSVLTLLSTQTFEGEVVKYPTPGKRVVIEGLAAPDMGAFENPYNQHRQFIDALLDGTPPPMQGWRGLQDMRVLEAAYAAAESGQRTPVESVWK